MGEVTPKLKYIESFCGAGGISMGLENAGFDLVYAFDIDLPSIESFKNNISEKCEVADAREVSGVLLAKRFGLKIGELDLFAGGPPCQGFSKQKRGAHEGDSRNDLVMDYCRLVEELLPKTFLFENVAIFGQKRGEEYLKKIFARLMSEYDFFPNFYNSADFGVPQTRERFVLVGVRKNLNSSFQFPKATVKKWKTVGETIGDLPEPPWDYSTHKKFPNHQRARVTDINIKRFSYVPQGGGWKDIPFDLRLDCHKKADVSKGGWPDVYGRLEWNGMCPTITGGFDSFSRGRYGHPVHDRPLTPREAARIQGFPDSFAFAGTRGDMRRQIGNAVPPPLAQALGLEIKRVLTNLPLAQDKAKGRRASRQLELTS